MILLKQEKTDGVKWSCELLKIKDLDVHQFPPNTLCLRNEILHQTKQTCGFGSPQVWNLISTSEPKHSKYARSTPKNRLAWRRIAWVPKQLVERSVGFASMYWYLRRFWVENTWREISAAHMQLGHKNIFLSDKFLCWVDWKNCSDQILNGSSWVYLKPLGFFTLRSCEWS